MLQKVRLFYYLFSVDCFLTVSTGEPLEKSVNCCSGCPLGMGQSTKITGTNYGVRKTLKRLYPGDPNLREVMGGSQCSNPARVTTLTTGLSNSTVVPPVLSTAVAVQQMEMDSTFLCRRPLDAQLKLWSRLRLC
ncbi:putative uncharacterized protein C6orf52 homolog isoform X3 [Ailuropoda melanoleuca]|uniref:putative uncharacterized protein C6orf52 homolog isoform X3 n=1 Tax=Ailuropoda melanoleuca TaxID=9646 RepID=UPI00149453EA|nr:putative uncharacterized protein C6orf52 homolog isoform X3 [Ailuropoda melanoleuca]